MSTSFATTESETFTITHARRIAAKLATDLKRIQRFYGRPSDASIADYEAEAIQLLKCGYLGTVTYGFQKNDKWIEPTVRYTARDLAGADAMDDDPGRIRPGADTSGASFTSHMTHSRAWLALTSSERESFEAALPFRRVNASEPGVDGFMQADRTYSAGGRALDRSSVRAL